MSVMIIAEAGINMQGSLEKAKRLADIAKDCGADIYKTQFQFCDPLTLQADDIKALYEYCSSIGMKFACTAFDMRSLEWLLANTKMEFVKIASCDWDKEDLIDLADESGLPIIQSLKYNFIPSTMRGKNLHVVPEYPTPLEHCNLQRIAESWCSGLSDHSGNPLIPSLAIALGAEIIECHLKENDTDEGPDMSSSLNPEQFKLMVSYARQAEAACNTTASQRRRAGL